MSYIFVQVTAQMAAVAAHAAGIRGVIIIIGRGAGDGVPGMATGEVAGVIFSLCGGDECHLLFQEVGM